MAYHFPIVYHCYNLIIFGVTKWLQTSRSFSNKGIHKGIRIIVLYIWIYSKCKFRIIKSFFRILCFWQDDRQGEPAHCLVISIISTCILFNLTLNFQKSTRGQLATMWATLLRLSRSWKVTEVTKGQHNGKKYSYEKCLCVWPDINI